MPEHIILRDLDIPDIRQLDVYVKHGGYQALRKAIKDNTPDQVIDIVKRANLRGRGGAGFPAGVKWSFLPKGVFPRYLVVNGDESEPGTFKDRQIMENNPHQLLEGIAITAYAIQSKVAYVYIRGEYASVAGKLQRALNEARAAGYLGPHILGSDFSLEVYIHLGAGAYICGEETALLESLEGRRGQPRNKPPFPAAVGLYNKPTVINNVETLTNIPPIIERGPEWYTTIGTAKSPGPKVFCLSGHVNRPGNYELHLGTPFRVLIEECGGGVRGGKKVKGILPAGAAAPILPATALDIPMDFESVQAAGSMLGSGSVIVMDEDTDMVWAAWKMIRFFKHESCGKCTPCREGTYWMLKLLERIHSGKAQLSDIDLLNEVANTMVGKCFCPLGEFSVSPVLGTLKHFRTDYEAAIRAQLKVAA